MDMLNLKKKPETKDALGRNMSRIHRLGQVFFDRELKKYDIGCGQQFFLLFVDRFPGISQWEMANKLGFDKGTTAKAVKKLEERGYLIKETNREDKRANCLYVTEEGRKIIQATEETILKWRAIITKNLTEEETALVEQCLVKMLQSASDAVKKGE